MIPKFLEKLLQEEYGNELTNKIIDGYSKKRFVTLRVNTIKTNISKIKEVLDNLNIRHQEVEWYKDALIILNVLESDLEKLDIKHKDYYKEKHTEVSEYLGVSYRHLLHVLAQFCKENLIKKHERGYIILDKERLQQLAAIK